MSDVAVPYDNAIQFCHTIVTDSTIQDWQSSACGSSSSLVMGHTLTASTDSHWEDNDHPKLHQEYANMPCMNG